MSGFDMSVHSASWKSSEPEHHKPSSRFETSASMTGLQFEFLEEVTVYVN